MLGGNESCEFRRSTGDVVSSEDHRSDSITFVVQLGDRTRFERIHVLHALTALEETRTTSVGFLLRGFYDPNHETYL